MTAAVAEKTTMNIKEFITYLAGELFNEFLYSEEASSYIDRQLKYREYLHDIEHFLKKVFKGEAKSSSEEINNLVNDYRQLLFAKAVVYYVECFNIKITIEDIKVINKIIKEELEKF